MKKRELNTTLNEASVPKPNSRTKRLSNNYSPRPLGEGQGVRAGIGRITEFLLDDRKIPNAGGGPATASQAYGAIAQTAADTKKPR
jgi:hypothetical protein